MATTTGSHLGQVRMGSRDMQHGTEVSIVRSQIKAEPGMGFAWNSHPGDHPAAGNEGRSDSEAQVKRD